LKFIYFIFILCLHCFSLRAQQTGQDIYEEHYQWRIRQEYLYGVYIPKDANEAVRELYRLTDAKSRAKFKLIHEDTAASKLFFSLGRWMASNWGFYDGSRLSINLQKSGINNPDDMARFLIILFNRSLNGRPLDIPGLLKKIQEISTEKKKKKLTTETSKN
jgi:hypothetical protein